MLRGRSTLEHLLVSICLVLIFEILCISFQDSDPQCGYGSVQDRSHRLHRELLQNQNSAPAQEGGIHLEGRIFCGCPYQSNCSTLNVREEGVLQIHKHIRRRKRREQSEHGGNPAQTIYGMTRYQQ